MNLRMKRSKDEGVWIDHPEGTSFLVRRPTNEEVDDYTRVISRDSWQKATPAMKALPMQELVVKVWLGVRELWLTPGHETDRELLIKAGLPETLRVDEPFLVDDYLNDGVKAYILRNEPSWPDLLLWINRQSEELREKARQHEAKQGKA